MIRSDHKAAVGIKDLGVGVDRGTYRKKLADLSRKYVVLWDVNSKRGWLVNGTSALLHLLRTSLEFNKTDDQSFAFLFEPEKFKEAKVPHNATSAMEILMDHKNLDMELYEEDERDESNANIKYRIRDRINELYEILEIIMDCQIEVDGKKGEGFGCSPRKNLEGWDFKNIATQEDVMYPSLAKVKTIGKGWVDFIRTIQAAVLFGRGFGDLMKPVAQIDSCSHWRVLPSGKYYLAVCMKDLSRIMDRFGRPTAAPPRLTERHVWHPFQITTNPKCVCNADADIHCELVQTVWPLHMSRDPTDGNSPLLEAKTGAVVFGHNTSLGWIWDDIGDPKQGQPPSSGEESDDYPEDSGVGSSIRTSNNPEPKETIPAHEHYKIAIICALPKELNAIRALFDYVHRDLPQHDNDTNAYILGRLGGHNVVAACLPHAEYGMNVASKVASDMEKTYTALKWYFVVGIGGGIPSRDHDIRLGDVVVGTRVVQHDMAKVIGKGPVQRTGIVQFSDRSLRTIVTRFESDLKLCPNSLEPHILRIVSQLPEYQSPGEDHDKLYEPHSRHEDGQRTCQNCNGSEVLRGPGSPGPHIHYGVIASGNQVIKDAEFRDQIGVKTEALCVEMESAGVMTTGRCLVIRGICNYADSHKNDGWHNYAAATAAAYTKHFLIRMSSLNLSPDEV